MHTMKKFFQTFKNALSSKHFYAEVLKGEKPIGFLYVFILQGFVALVITVVFSAGFFAALPRLRTELIKAYPAELEFTIKKGEVSINQPTPYYLFEKTFVIDTSAKADIETLEKYKAKALITKTAAINKRNDGRVEITPLKEIPDFTLNQAKLVGWVEKLSKFAPLIPVFMFVATWIFATLGVYISSLVYALVVWLTLYLLGHQSGYKRAYSITLYAQTIPSALKLRFLPTLLIVVIVTLLAYKKR